MPPIYAWPFLFLSFPLLALAVAGRGRRSAFGAGFCFGVGYFAVCFYWIGIAFLIDAATYLWMMPVMVGALAGVWAWITVTQSDPAVSSELISSEIVDDHTATAVIRVQWGDEPVDAQCTVRALAHDKAVVGQATFEPAADAGPDHEVEIATERRATAVENIGCTAEDQPRPR